MIAPPSGMRVLIASKPVNFRKCANGLADAYEACLAVRRELNKPAFQPFVSVPMGSGQPRRLLDVSVLSRAIPFELLRYISALGPSNRTI